MLRHGKQLAFALPVLSRETDLTVRMRIIIKGNAYGQGEYKSSRREEN